MMAGAVKRLEYFSFPLDAGLVASYGPAHGETKQRHP